MQSKLVVELASLVDARLRCMADNDASRQEWADKHGARIKDLCREFLPSGSGFDNGSKIDLDTSTPDKLVFSTAFHHMDDHGFYDGWTEHRITVKPSLIFGFTLDVSGKDRNEIKDLIDQSFDATLNTLVGDP